MRPQPTPPHAGEDATGPADARSRRPGCRARPAGGEHGVQRGDARAGDGGHGSAVESAAAQVAEATQALGAAGQQDLIWGHVAMRDPEGRGLWIKAAGLGFEETTGERVMLVSWNGDVVAGTGRRPAEYALHAGILRRRPDVDWVAHTHPGAVNVFTSLNVPLRAISHDGVLFCQPQIPRFPDGDLITTAERGRLLADSIGDHVACLLPAHGLVCVGASAAQAVMHAVLLARACALAVAAAAAGGPAVWSSDDELSAKRASAWPQAQLEAGYAYLKRKAAR